jgi:hypothetical protein
MTSRIESGLLRTIWLGAGERDDGDGMTYPERSVMCRRRGLVGEYEEVDGAEDVKYAGSSGSESSDAYFVGSISIQPDF